MFTNATTDLLRAQAPSSFVAASCHTLVYAANMAERVSGTPGILDTTQKPQFIW